MNVTQNHRGSESFWGGKFHDENGAVIRLTRR